MKGSMFELQALGEIFNATYRGVFHARADYIFIRL